jgi:hypothetical protein
MRFYTKKETSTLPQMTIKDTKYGLYESLFLSINISISYLLLSTAGNAVLIEQQQVDLVGSFGHCAKYLKPI